MYKKPRYIAIYTYSKMCRCKKQDKKTKKKLCTSKNQCAFKKYVKNTIGELKNAT